MLRFPEISGGIDGFLRIVEILVYGNTPGDRPPCP